MKRYVFARKLGMTQVIDESGDVVPASVLKVMSASATESGEPNSYRIGFDPVAPRKVSRPLVGQSKGLADVYRYIRVLRMDSECPGVSAFDLSAFSEKDVVNVRGVSKGKGFAGTIKRWNFNRGPMSHGSKSHRIPGSIGGGTTPGRVWKGKKMAGRMGGDNVMIKNLLVVRIDKQNGLLFVKGAVPGAANGIVEVIG